MGRIGIDQDMNRFSAHRRTRTSAAFTLVEALVSISITALAAGVLLLGIGSSLRTTRDALQQTVARGMAEQLMDEVLGGRYASVDVNGNPTEFGPSSFESSGMARERYDDVDDYDLLRIQPPQDLWGVELGKDDGKGGQRNRNSWAPAGLSEGGQENISFFRNWRQEVDIYYVDESDLTVGLSAGQVSDYRVVEVRIVVDDPDTGTRELVKLRQVLAHVPPIQ